jgi:hypothetical protein
MVRDSSCRYRFQIYELTRQRRHLKIRRKASNGRTASGLGGSMDPATKARLEAFALEGLEATADDDERWSFLFRTEGALDFIYCPWETVEEFDGDIEGLELSWSEERLEMIEGGEAEPNEKELAEWRQAKAQLLADDSEWSRVAWAVPLRIEGQVAGWALFLCEDDPDDAPILNGIFESAEDAKIALAIEGVIASAHR